VDIKRTNRSEYSDRVGISTGGVITSCVCICTLDDLVQLFYKRGCSDTNVVQIFLEMTKSL